ncbi:sugar kinase [Gordonia sp. NPDC003424]
MPEPTDLDVLVIGEVLVEVSSAGPIGERAATTLDFSGDALNVACAAASAGARTALLARIPEDDLGDAIVDKLDRFGVRTDTVIRGSGQHGLYLSHGDPTGEREFTYLRGGSFGSTLAPSDLDADLLAATRIATASGIATAVSASAAALVERAAQSARRFVYDPNLRLRLTTASDAGDALIRLLPHCSVITPSWPTEIRTLLQLSNDATEFDAIARLRELGADDVVLTRGARGSLVADGGTITDVPVIPAPAVVDQTGAGDCMTGTLCARLAAGDDLVDAVRLGAAAASLSVGGLGGTGAIAGLDRIRAHSSAHSRTTQPVAAGSTS